MAVRALRRVVATTLKLGNAATAFSIMRAKFCGVEGREVLVDALHLEAERGGEVLLVAEHDVHEGASSRFTSCARFWPPMDFQSEGR